MPYVYMRVVVQHKTALQ